jgi:hypothetical protein
MLFKNEITMVNDDQETDKTLNLFPDKIKSE